MTPLSSELRTVLQRAVTDARQVAESAAEAALTALGVTDEGRPVGLSDEQNRLRVALRAKASQLGGGSVSAGLPLLIEEVAYGQWHRMLFARFLAENGLLMHPSGVQVTLEECAELAPEEGEPDAWSLAAHYAAAMLPGIFGRADPSVRVPLPPEGRQRLETIIAELPPTVFTADDALGWVYQFWQEKRKAEINKSGRKIGGADIGPVTQLFTEDYMVRFLLENTLGAWWAARHPGSPLVKEFTYLRLWDDGAPAAGTFPGWPGRAANVTVMDPCCGSGHFLVAAFEMLRRMRMEEEGLNAADAGDAVLRDNLFGLEIDARCIQIAAFALALTAWKSGGYRPLPSLNLACTGIPVVGQLSDWTRLAGDDTRLCYSLEHLYGLFRDAAEFGSLINPADIPARERLFAAEYAEIAPLLERALSRETAGDPVAGVFGVAARAMALAATALARTYTLVATNVPYLTIKRQGTVLKRFCGTHYPAAKADLAVTFLERCRAFAANGGTCAVVTPQNWLFLGSYREIRAKLLRQQVWNMLGRLGPGAFGEIGGEVVNVSLVVFTNSTPAIDQTLIGIDATMAHSPPGKARTLSQGELKGIHQHKLLGNPDARVTLVDMIGRALLGDFAECPRGVVSGDTDRWIRCFWEVEDLDTRWRLLQSTVRLTQPYGGREHVIDWSKNGRGMLRPGIENVAYKRRGVAVSLIGQLSCTLYTGELYDNNTAALVPRNPAMLPALWEFCRCPEFHHLVRQLDQKMNVTNATFLKVPFDLDRWQIAAQTAAPLPLPYSDDPTQWIFRGNPGDSTSPLQVTIARLLGYRWPQQESDDLESFADADGIVCIPPVAGDQSAAERLRALLAAAYRSAWSLAEQERLLTAAGFAGKNLEDWLRDGFFAQHCRLFHNRPFLWQVWDGRKDGFSALLNYHQLDRARLERLIYTYLSAWIGRQQSDAVQKIAGAEGRRDAALALRQKLERILEGEPPYDIYVRWKPIYEQPIGWEPDLNDGVRLNIRPFVEAGILRSRFSINWSKDRGSNPDGSERINDVHLTRQEKIAARQKAGVALPGGTGTGGAR